jgi:hypothetical protein
VVKSWLAANQQRIPVQSLQFDDNDAVKTMKAVGECLAVVYKNRSLSIPGGMSHQYTQLHGPGNLRVIPHNADAT